MIYILLLIIVFFSLSANEIFLIMNYGKLFNYPLRRKLISDTTNILLFFIISWCFGKLYSLAFVLKLSVLFVILLVFFSYRNFFKQGIHVFLRMLRHKFAFHTTCKDFLRNRIKMLEVNITSQKRISEIGESQNFSSYRECVVLTVILFCKHTLLISATFLIFICFAEPYKFSSVTQYINLSIFNNETYKEILSIINQAGLAFSIYKFRYDWKAIKCEKSDNPRYLEIIKRLERDEHAI